MELAPAATALSSRAPSRGMSRSITDRLLLTLYPVIVGAVCWPGGACENIGEIDSSDVWISAGATPSPLMRETRGVAALAVAAIPSPAFFAVLVTPSVTRAKSGAAPTLPSPMTSTQRSLLMSINRSSADAGGIAASVARNVMKTNLSRNVFSRLWPSVAYVGSEGNQADCRRLLARPAPSEGRIKSAPEWKIQLPHSTRAQSAIG